MRYVNKFLSLILTLAILCSAFVFSTVLVSAATYVYYGDFKCEVLGNSKLNIAGYEGTETDITLPTQLGTNTVVGISANAFEDSTLNSVTIPEGYTSIGNYAFYNADSITSITLPSTITSLGVYPFSNSDKLANVDITKATSLTALPTGFLMGCTSYKSFLVPSNISKIGMYAFSKSAVSSVTFSNPDAKLDSYVFQNCASLTNVVLPDNLTTIPDYTFNSCTNLKTVNIPNKVTSLGNRVFYNCTGLETIVLPDKVKTIGVRTFSNCSSLSSLKLSLDLTSIGNYAFENCSALTDLELSPFLSSLGSNVFDGCSGIQKLFVPASVTSIGSNCFYPAIQQTMTVQVLNNSVVKDYCETSFVQYEVLDLLKGDFDLDGEVNIRDVTSIQKHLVGTEKHSYQAIGLADVLNDGQLDVRDVSKIQKYISKQIDTLD